MQIVCACVCVNEPLYIATMYMLSSYRLIKMQIIFVPIIMKFTSKYPWMVPSTIEVPHFASSLFPFSIENIPSVLQVNYCNKITVKILICLHVCVLDIHTVAVMQAEETYENLANSFQSVFGELNSLVKNPILKYR